MRGRLTVVGALVAAALVPAAARAEIYNPTTAEYIPTSYYYPAPSPPLPDPPPPYYPPLTTPAPVPGSGGGDSTPPARDRVLGYKPSAAVSRQANRQMAALFAKRLGKRNFDRARFLREADKGTFRNAFAQLIEPLGWSATDWGDALAAYTISSWMIANGVAELSGSERIGAQEVERALRRRLRANPRMKRQSDRAKQLVTERLNTVTIVQVVQYANGDESTRAAQAEATRQAGLKTFKGDLTRVELTSDGFEPRAQP